MRPPVTQQPVQPPQPPQGMIDDDATRRFDRSTDMPGDAAPVVDWPEFSDDHPPLEERRRR